MEVDLSLYKPVAWEPVEALELRPLVRSEPWTYALVQEDPVRCFAWLATPTAANGLRGAARLAGDRLELGRDPARRRRYVVLGRGGPVPMTLVPFRAHRGATIETPDGRLGLRVRWASGRWRLRDEGGACVLAISPREYGVHAVELGDGPPALALVVLALYGTFLAAWRSTAWSSGGSGGGGL